MPMGRTKQVYLVLMLSLIDTNATMVGATSKYIGQHFDIDHNPV